MLEMKTYKNGQQVYILKSNYLIFFYENGKIKSEGKYINDKLEGRWKYYNTKGELIKSGHFSQGLKNGQWIRYDKGKIVYNKNIYNVKKIKN